MYRVNSFSLGVGWFPGCNGYSFPLCTLPVKSGETLEEEGEIAEASGANAQPTTFISPPPSSSCENKADFPARNSTLHWQKIICLTPIIWSLIQCGPYGRRTKTQSGQAQLNGVHVRDHTVRTLQFPQNCVHSVACPHSVIHRGFERILSSHNLWDSS